MDVSLPEYKGLMPNNIVFVGDGEHTPTNWIKEIQIGCGGFSEVFKASTKLNNEKVHFHMAVKQIKIGLPQKEKKKCEGSVRTEIDVLKKIVHERVVSFYGFCSTKFMFYIFMEHMAAGSLSDYISEHGALRLNLVKHFTKQLLEGVEYLHSQRIIHRDIKPGNILIKDDRNIKLADFGVSKIFNEISKAYTADVGSLRYMAPEMFRKNGHKYPVDIWSSGCVIVEMATGENPFPDLEREQIYGILLGANPSPMTQYLPEEVNRFVMQIFKKEPTERPNAKDLLMDNFITEINLTSEERLNVHNSPKEMDSKPSLKSLNEILPFLVNDILAALFNEILFTFYKVRLGMTVLFLKAIYEYIVKGAPYSRVGNLQYDFDSRITSIPSNSLDAHSRDDSPHKQYDVLKSSEDETRLSKERLESLSRAQDVANKISELCVFVKTLDGKTLTINVEKNERVEIFRKKISDKTNLPEYVQYLVSPGGRKLTDGVLLSAYDIVQHSTIYCQGRLRGG